jgi:hypothetical protein
MAEAPATDLQKFFPRLIDEIREGECVLLLGPDIVWVEGVPFMQKMRDLIYAAHREDGTQEEDIVFNFKRDGLFLFAEKENKHDVQYELRSCLNQQQPPDLYRQIACIPFHLIISVNPDHFMPMAYDDLGVKHDFAYFNHAVPEENTPLEEPTSKRPLVYNLCGSHRKPASMVLDYDDLFRLIKGIMSEKGLPVKLRRKLEDANTFLFLGFHFEKWYTQLLLRLLSGDKNPRKFAIDTVLEDEQTNTFLIKQFKIEFKKPEDDFFQTLFRACQKEVDFLRGNGAVETEITPEAIVRWLESGQTERGIKALRSLMAGTEFAEDLILLSNRYNRWKEKSANKTADSRDLEVEYNQIVKSLIGIVQSIHS